MRPKLLEIEGLQSFIEKQTIDFDKINQNGLFGIFGNTGSGKSTILDAITLALYGKVKRAGNTKQGIINTNCTVTRVMFMFEISKITYKVEREYKRKKASDNLVESKTVRLIQINKEESVPLCDKEEAVNRRIEEILGLNHKDFTKAVVLPQNNFQEFLLLGNAERRQMLERVFYLEEYGKELMSKISDKIMLLKNQRDDLYIKLKGYEDASDEALENYKREYREVFAKKEISDKVLSKVEKEYEEKKRIFTFGRELEEVIKREKELSFKDQDIKKEEDRLERALKADLLKEKLEQVQQSHKLMIDMQNEIKKCEEELPKYIENGAKLNKRYDELKKSLDHRNFLYDNMALEISVKSLSEEIEAITKKENVLKNDIEKKKLEQKKIEEYIKSKNEEYEKLRENEVASMCLFLAKDLKDGDVCPVCGGTYKKISQTDVECSDIDINKLNDMNKDIMSASVKKERFETELKMKNDQLLDEQKNKNAKEDELKKKNDEYQKILKTYNITSITEELNKMKNKDILVRELEKNIKENEWHVNDNTNKKIAALARYDTYSKQYEKDSGILKNNMVDNGFKTTKEIKESLLQEIERQSVKQKIENYKKSVSENLGQKKSIQEKLQGRTITPKEWEKIDENYHTLVDENKLLNTQYGIAKNTYDKSIERNKEWNAILKDYTKKDLNYNKHIELRELLNGDRGKDNSFIDYIAEERLRYLAKRASDILGVMTQYKFELKLDTESGFIIVDNKNGGVSRKVSTLSGGETFLTSLSLALALSEQIQLKGQSPLEFFFLDEGFGSLDNELLDLVIDALERISRKERVIGVISHIPELRQRIMQRVIVTAPIDNGTGSIVKIEKG
ncbi:MAG: SMC family ATPase [Clostridiales bacterium]|nr:SMC family ATPase [Clostridiales bacterium]